MPQKPQSINPSEWEDFDTNEWEDVDTGQPLSFTGKVWKAISEPLWKTPSETMRKNAMDKTDPNALKDKPDWLKKWMGFNAGVEEGVGDLVSGLTSPLNVALTALGGGEFAAGRAGLPNIARMLGIGTKVAAAPMVAHGAAEMVSPDSSITQRIMGVGEMAGGASIVGAPLRPRVNPAIGKSAVKPTVELPPETIDLPLRPPEEVLAAKPTIDPNLNQGVGDPIMAGSEPYKAPMPAAVPEAPKVVSEPIKAPVDPAIEAAKLRQAITNIESSMEKKGSSGSEGTLARLQQLKTRLNELNVASPPVFYLKQHQQTPLTIKRLLQNGYEMDTANPVREDGAVRYIKTGRVQDLPILEAEVPLKQKGGGNPPPNPPKKGFDEGDITPPEKEPVALPESASKVREAYELSRALMSIDLPFSTSAAFRQALPHAGTTNWFKAFWTSMKAYGSEASYNATMQRISEMPLFRERPKPGGKPGQTQQSFAEEMGVRMTDLGKLSKHEEVLRSKWAEKIPVYGKVVRASNRAYTAFLNDLRANLFESLMKDSKIISEGGMNNVPLSKAIAEFINDTTGRSSLKTDIGFGKHFNKEVSLEKGAKLLTDTLFSPRLMASRIRMLNPQTYMMAPPGVRKQYVYAMMRSIGAWWTIASLAELMGAKVSKDPNSADFGKIKIGNTRLDAGGGLQQFLVLGSRMRPEWAGGGGITSSTSGKFNEFGKGYKRETRLSTLAEFGPNKLHPTLKFAIDLLRASEDRPVNLMDRTVQMYLPIIAGDIAELIKEDPSLLPLVIPAGTFGMGSQTYTAGIEEPNFIPDSWDIKIGGKRKKR